MGKRTYIMGEIFAKHITDKGLPSKIFNGHTLLNSRPSKETNKQCDLKMLRGPEKTKKNIQMASRS